MGVLDEAIRAHLDLKRKHGAEEGEIARQEREALGPARRAAAPAQDETEAEEPVAEEAEEAPPAPVPVDEAELAEEGFAEEPPLEELAFEETEEDVPPPADPDAPADDVLEETPEFLQETPEHDRLWFEQKPPRDFDFDE